MLAYPSGHAHVGHVRNYMIGDVVARLKRMPGVTRELEQWFFRITYYADELLSGMEQLGEWPDKVLTMQQNWVGRSEGARVRFTLETATTESSQRNAGADPDSDAIDAFTTRI